MRKELLAIFHQLFAHYLDFLCQVGETHHGASALTLGTALHTSGCTGFAVSQ